MIEIGQNFKEEFRGFIKEKILPFHEEWEKEGKVDHNLFMEAGNDGFLCPSMPKKWGGRGLPFRYNAFITQELTKHGATGPMLYIQSNIIAPFLEKFATEEIKDIYIPHLVSGQSIGALANSEQIAGSDFSLLQTEAKEVENGFILNGSKIYISNAHNADIFIVLAKVNSGFGLFLVESSFEGFKKGPILDKMGLKAQDTGELIFENCFIPKDKFLGFSKESKEFLQTRLRTSMALFAQGLLKNTLLITKEYTEKRELFNKTVIDFQNTKFILGQIYAESVVTDSFLQSIILKIENKETPWMESNIAKMIITENLGKAVDQCSQLFGASGFMENNKISKNFRDAKIQRIYGGATEILKSIIFKDFLTNF